MNPLPAGPSAGWVPMASRLCPPGELWSSKTIRVSIYITLALALSLALPTRYNPWPSFSSFWFDEPAAGQAVPEPDDVRAGVAAAERALQTDAPKEPGQAATDRFPAASTPAACLQNPRASRTFGHLTVPCVPGAPDGEHALTRFFARLDGTRRGEGLTRVSYFSDSIAAGDKITSTLRRRLQGAFGCGGPGYVALYPLRTWHFHTQVGLRLSEAWKPVCPIGHPSRDRLYGFGGISVTAQGTGNSIRLSIKSGDPSADVIQIHFLRHPEGATFALLAGGKELRLVDTRGERRAEDLVRVPVPGGYRDLTIESRSAGVLRLGAAFLERDAPGVVVDAVSLTGVRYENWAAVPADHLRAEVIARAPDLVAFQLGLNESDTGVEENYPELIVRLFTQLRGARPLSCLVVGPSDKVEKHAGGYRTLPVIRRIAQLQREAALTAGCAWFDTQAAMGGEAAIFRWYKHQPPLAMGDLTHITVEGGELLGDLLYHDLLLAIAAR